MAEKFNFRKEGEPAFPTEAENETSGAGEAEHTEAEIDPSQAGGENKPVEKPIPFDQDPAVQDYISRQVDKRVKEAETKNLETIEAIRKEFGGQRKDNAGQEAIPKWFGGNQEQWNEYRADLDARLTAAEERAIHRVTENSTKESEAKTKATEEATEYMRSELVAIAADKTLNPSGKPFTQAQAESLLKIVVKEELIDTKGRWNYRAGMKILNAQPPKKPVANDGKNKDRKTLAGATVEGSEGGGDSQRKTFKTSEDFKKKRPW